MSSFRPLGFSTGAIAKADFRAGLAVVRKHHLPAVELSALRESELTGLVAAFSMLDLSSFSYVSLHAPSRLVGLSERDVVELLHRVSVGVIVHPDIIHDEGLWRSLDDRLILENMDQRKPTGRTLLEMEGLFQRLPEAKFCFDIGHAHQVDPTMSVGAALLFNFCDRLVQVHMSEVTASGAHVAMSYSAQKSFLRLAGMIPPTVPIILESLVGPELVSAELMAARVSLGLTSSPVDQPEAVAG